MLRSPVTSSNLKSAAWDNGALFLEFQSGDWYRYDDAPMQAYSDLVHADSVGKYFHQYIKPNFPATKLTESQAQAHGLSLPATQT